MHKSLDEGAALLCPCGIVAVKPQRFAFGQTTAENPLRRPYAANNVILPEQ
jgi:hypothetical protein